jgi:hypothetical protein
MVAPLAWLWRRLALASVGYGGAAWLWLQLALVAPLAWLGLAWLGYGGAACLAMAWLGLAMVALLAWLWRGLANGVRCPMLTNWLLVRSYLPCTQDSSPGDGSIRNDHVRPPTWRCRSCFGEMLLARTIARHLQTDKQTEGFARSRSV